MGCRCNEAKGPTSTWTITYPDGRTQKTMSQSAVRIAQARGATVVEQKPPAAA